MSNNNQKSTQKSDPTKFTELNDEPMYGGEVEGYTTLREASRRTLDRVFNNLD